MRISCEFNQYSSVVRGSLIYIVIYPSKITLKYNLGDTWRSYLVFSGQLTVKEMP